MSMADGTNGATTTYTITFRTQIPLYDGEKLYITFPSDIDLPSSNSGSCGTVRSISSIDCSISSNTLYVTLTDITSSDGTFSFTLTNVVNSHSTKPVTGFTFSFYTAANYPVA